ncbi:MAG: chromosome condensation protein CrcB [Desulfobulbaceae bacterium A2]|nr:MAG: chromosome condensation protein CrcB [Desulfobulbaceae bacterium A2]
MLRLLLIGSGGFLGSICRYGLAGMVQRLSPEAIFPWGTVAVNLLGCLCIGGLAGLADTRHYFSAESRAFLFIGVLGGFTTFSTFGLETFNLLRDGDLSRALGNALLQVFVGLFCVWLGYTAATWR